ncbi:hypothetical protein [Agrobacterium genomosp. 13]|uniref:Uncharacterized protein n=1 Tax=Agrobacterium genomosp. 13 str. CFBP 6927 TaxID=1183428 RepID=A0ABM9VBZ0_9HYPH|nr:hypothetical protein [Agrobacterium genomosp. 13]CUX14195.1 hypothetical protein AGR13a_Cc170301 [Agrobacterium genomosp. 13 str. CFBP 6927]
MIAYDVWSPLKGGLLRLLWRYPRKLPGVKSLRTYPLLELPRDDNAFSVTNLGTVQMVRVGKKAAGREIYGTEYLQFPKVLAA